MKRDCNIADLPKEITLNTGVHLTLDIKKHQGIDNLSDIQWFVYDIVNREEFDMDYDNICLSLYRITEIVRSEAAKKIVQLGVSEFQTQRPHIDYITGNIHPSKAFVESENDGSIKQLVLCNGLGPHTPKVREDEKVYVYRNSPRQSGAKVHKACYYPLIDYEQGLEDNWRYKLLEEVWKIIKRVKTDSDI